MSLPFSELPELRLGEVHVGGHREVRDGGDAPIAYAGYRARAGFDRLFAAVSATRAKTPRVIEVRSPDGRPLMSVGVAASRRGRERYFELLLPDGSRAGHVVMKKSLTFELFGATGQPVGAIDWFDAPLEVPGLGTNPRGRSRLVIDPAGAEVGRFSYAAGARAAEKAAITFGAAAAPELPALCLAAELRPIRH